MNLLKISLAIVWKDVLVELRTREVASAVFVFVILLLVIFSFSFDLRVERVASVAPGVLWVTIAFAGTLELNRSFHLELEEGCLDGLLLAPVDRIAVYFGKLLGNLAFLSAVELVMIPIFSALFNINLIQPLLLLTVFLGTFGFAAVGTLLSAMTVGTRAREVLLPILLFPITLPAVISAVKVTAGVLDGLPVEEFAMWIRLLVGFDIVFLVVSYLTFEYVVES